MRTGWKFKVDVEVKHVHKHVVITLVLTHIRRVSLFRSMEPCSVPHVLVFVCESWVSMFPAALVQLHTGSKLKQPIVLESNLLSRRAYKITKFAEKTLFREIVRSFH